MFCKDAHSFAFNKAAWGTFFTIIQVTLDVQSHDLVLALTCL
jgi:hypothetical protein